MAKYTSYIYLVKPPAKSMVLWMLPVLQIGWCLQVLYLPKMPTFSQIFSGLCRLDSLFLPTTRILGKSYVVRHVSKTLELP